MTQNEQVYQWIMSVRDRTALLAQVSFDDFLSSGTVERNAANGLREELLKISDEAQTILDVLPMLEEARKDEPESLQDL